MPNITLSIPEDLLKNGRRYAQKRGTSLNALVRELLAEKVREPKNSINLMIERLRQSTGDSKGIKIERQQLHRY